jgi:uncharacterized membrane protein YgdD (TMEM256/DUF423 family)
MNKHFLIWGFAFGFLAVVLGAFGAHSLKNLLSNEAVESFQTGVRYQMYHALLLLILGSRKELQSKLIFYFLVIGTLLFSFSIYLLAIRSIIGFEALVYLGPITPIGGSLLIIAWFILAIKATKITTQKQ